MEVDSGLIAGCREGLIYYNSLAKTWDQKVETGPVIALCAFHGNTYVLNSISEIKIIRPDRTLKNIDFDLKKFNLRSLTDIRVINNKLYASSYEGVFYKDLSDTTWHKMNLLSNIHTHESVWILIEFQGNLMAFCKDGICLSTDGKNFNQIIPNEVILKKSIANNIHIGAKEINNYKIKRIEPLNGRLYAISSHEIFFSDDLMNWERLPKEILTECFGIIPLGCDGQLVWGDKLKYSFNNKDWIELPVLKTTDNTTQFPNDVFIFQNTIFSGHIMSEINGIWQLTYRKELSFQ